MRGKAEYLGGISQPVRIIPACAGKSVQPSVKKIEARDHPRVCGEKSAAVSGKPLAMGSSPRVRGKDPPRHKEAEGLGIIPAGAGRRRRACCDGAQSQDHPRGCGEKTWRSSRPERLGGSSPRVRGEEDKKEHRHARPGIIPAGAGRRGQSGLFGFGC